MDMIGKIPVRIWLLLAIPVVLAGLIWKIYYDIDTQIHPGQAAAGKARQGMDACLELVDTWLR
jgi:hypothetical protein